MNTDDYVNKTNHQLSGKDNYKELQNDTTLEYNEMVNNTTERFQKEKSFTEKKLQKA